MKEEHMRYGQLLVMILGWWSAGLLLSAKTIQCVGVLAPSDPAIVTPPCPKLSWKCWLASILSLIYGLLWYFLLGLKGGFVSLDYLASVFVSAVFGAAFARIFCPKV
jgi:hypothetical protein